MILIGETDITPLLKALQKFEKFRTNIGTEQEQAGAIQAFTYTVIVTPSYEAYVDLL